MIRFEDVSVTYADAAAPALEHVDLTVPEGELVLLVGPSGVGKSTLLQAVSGLVPHFTGGTLRGRVTVGGRDTRTHRPRELADLVGTVGQDPLAHFVTDVVEDELAYGMESLGLPAAVMRRRGRGDPRPAGPGGAAGPAHRDAVRRAAAAGGDRVRAGGAPEGAGAGRADVGAGPGRGGGGPGGAAAAGARPGHDGADGGAPAGAGRAVRGPGGAAGAARGSGRGGPARRGHARVPCVPAGGGLSRVAGWTPPALTVRDARRRAEPLRQRLASAAPVPVRPQGDAAVPQGGGRRADTGTVGAGTVGAGTVGAGTVGAGTGAEVTVGAGAGGLDAGADGPIGNGTVGAGTVGAGAEVTVGAGAGAEVTVAEGVVAAGRKAEDRPREDRPREDRPGENRPGGRRARAWWPFARRRRRRPRTTAWPLVEGSPCGGAGWRRCGGWTLAVGPGEAVALMGRNGAGKSTLLGALAGHGGAAAAGSPRAAAPRTARSAAELVRGVGLVPQEPRDLLYADTVAAECAGADADAGAEAGTCRALVAELLPGVPDGTHPRDLSEGQRLALALAVVLTGAAPAAAARRTDPRPGLRGEGAAGRGAQGARRARPRHPDGHARRGAGGGAGAPGGDPRGRRGGRRRADARGRGVVPGVRPCRSARCWRRSRG